MSVEDNICDKDTVFDMLNQKYLKKLSSEIEV